MRRISSVSIASFLVLVSVVGCGSGRPDRVPVSGRVILDGEPLSLPSNVTAFLQFAPVGARAANAEIDTEGRFTLTTFSDEGQGDGCVIGTHKVSITIYEPISVNSRKWIIPPKYSKRNTSDLTVTIEEATDSLELELSWESGKPFVERLAGGGEEGEVDPTTLLE